MKTTILYLVVFLSVFSSCNSQELRHKNKSGEKTKPHETVTVNRKYDENGNLIEFDSTYTSYYSNFNSDTINLDSVFSKFPTFFNDNFFNPSSNSALNPFWTEDSVLDSHFFHDDYFEQQFISQNKHMLRMIQEMDSIKNAFFEQHGKNK